MKNETIIRFFTIGIALSLVGLYFLILPKTVIYCTELGQILLAALGVIIAISLANLYLNLKRPERSKGKNNPRI